MCRAQQDYLAESGSAGSPSKFTSMGRLEELQRVAHKARKTL
jgi:hypothetical protein